MKLITYIRSILAAAAILAMAGCDKDFLDTKIDTNNTPTSIATNRTSLFQFANAFYTSLPYGFNSIDNNLFAAATDEAQQTVTAASSALLFNQAGLNANVNPDGNSYRVLYDGIRAANFFLDYSKGFCPINSYPLLEG